MEAGGKIFAGAAATVVLALVGHSMTGETFISGLEQQAQTELAARGLDAAKVRFGRDPLSRSAVLDGELADGGRQEALNIVMAIPGVSQASWQDQAAIDAADGAPAGPAAPAAGKAAQCQAEVNKIITARPISFRSGSAYVSPDSNQILDLLATALKPCDGLLITVEGHTDDNGDRQVNQIMSQERADRIKAGLVDRGVAERLITATGYGATRPRAKGTDAAADAQNRRIEFRIGNAEDTAQNDAKAQQGD